jgi:hypothetical protein
MVGATMPVDTLEGYLLGIPMRNDPVGRRFF